MRSPGEVTESNGPSGAAPAESGQPASTPARRERPPGGKALLRLRQFAIERGLDGTLHPLTSEVRPSAVGRTYAGVADELQGLARGHALATSRTAGAAPAPAPALPSWEPLGPVVMHNGQTYGSGRIDVSGRVSAIAVDPSNRNHLLVGSAAGGVWESHDRGVTWSPRTDTMPTLTVGAIEFSPSEPATVYCGTGEGNRYWFLGASLLSETNGGTTWSVLASNPFVGVGFYDLVIDPAAATRLLAATTSGLYVSTDGGSTWAQKINQTTWGLDVRAASGGQPADWLAASADGLHHSTDNGQTWSAVPLPSAPASWSRLDVAVAKSNPAIAFAFGASGNDSYLYQRDASGTWTSITPPAGLSISQAWYDWYIEVAPDQVTQIYLGAIDLYRGDQAAGGTWSWTDLSSKATGDSIHPDQHALVFDPTDPNTIYAGSDGGFYTSPNRGVNWTSLNNGLAITEIEYTAQDYGSSYWLFGGTQDNGSIRYTGSSVWDHAADGDGGDCGVNRTDPNTVFHTFYNMGMERSTSKGSFGSWTGIGPSVPQGYSNLF